jgi:methionyl-tRNA formyltransferase
MARIVVIGGIESTYHNVQAMHEMGEDIVMFYTRGKDSPGWEGVDMVDESHFPFAQRVPRTLVHGHINDHVEEIRALQPDVIYSLGWQQMYSRELLSICKVVGIHESLLPQGAGAVPIANAILHGVARTGTTLFWLDAGADTGAIIGQLQGLLDPRVANSTALYQEAIALGMALLRMYVPHINAGTAPAIPQDLSRRTAYTKVDWRAWPEAVVERARVYPYA